MGTLVRSVFSYGISLVFLLVGLFAGAFFGLLLLVLLFPQPDQREGMGGLVYATSCGGLMAGYAALMGVNKLVKKVFGKHA